MAIIAPALLSANFAFWADSLEMAKLAGAAMLHVDVMDGHFRPEITIGQPVIASLRRATDLVLDVHLLIERPERFVGEFVGAGAERISIHPESTWHLRRVLELIRAHGAKAGVALNTVTPLESLEEVLGGLDFLTILSADLGVDDLFLPQSVAKVARASRMRADRHLDFAIQVEGGLGPEHVEDLVRAGADILVVGSAIFHSADPRTRLMDLIRRAVGARSISKV